MLLIDAWKKRGEEKMRFENEEDTLNVQFEEAPKMFRGKAEIEIKELCSSFWASDIGKQRIREAMNR